MRRNPFFDNAKIILIFLVVFGHLIQPFTEASKAVDTLYTWIYTFHMPAFILIAGFFAKGSGNASYIAKLFRRLIIPYLIFQIIYTIYYFFLGKDNWLTDNIFYPHWSLWFLFSLFCWHIMLILYKKLSPVTGISLSVLIGIIVGYFDQVGHMFSLSRTFVFFPYFLLGYWLTEKHMHRIQTQTFRFVSLFILLSAAIFIYFLPEINTGLLLASKSYEALGFDTYGSIARFIVYMTSIVMAFSVLSWVPSNRLPITSLGERTLYVYLLHGFIVQYFRQNEILQLETFVDLLVIIALSGLIVFLLASKWVVTIWQPLIEGSTSKLRALVTSKKKWDRESYVDK